MYLLHNPQWIAAEKCDTQNTIQVEEIMKS